VSVINCDQSLAEVPWLQVVCCV